MADARTAYANIGMAFGIEVIFDDSTPATKLRLDLDQVTFEQALNAVALVTRTFWTPLSSHEVMVASDTPAKRKDLERWLLRTFYFPQVSSPQELTEISGLLRSVFDLRFVTQSPNSATITVRGPRSMVLAATQFVETLRMERPQVMLDFEVYEISGQQLRDIGINLPSQITLFVVPQSTTAGAATSATQSSINQGVALSSANRQSGVMAALLSHLTQQDPLASLAQPTVTTLNLGQTQVGIQIPPASATFSASKSRSASLSRTTLRASQNNPTTFRLGTRYPVITATSGFAAASAPATPVVSYVDLGLTINATPTIRERDLTLQLDMEIAALGSAILNGIPSISHRNYKGAITVKDHESAVIASSLTLADTKTLSDTVGLGSPLAVVTGSQTAQSDVNELLIVITPHITTAAPINGTTAILLPSN
jgi:type II secretory pathway component GspD/PulD (secretin)